MFASWAEGQRARLRDNTRLHGLLCFLLASYEENGAQVAVDWCEWWMREAETVSERLLAMSAARLLEDEEGGAGNA